MSDKNTGSRLAGKVAIITGGGHGFGEGIARRFAQEGAKVLITDINETDGQRVAQAVPESISFFKADAISAEDWDRLMDTAQARYGRIDCLINNAGTTYRNKPTLEVTEAEFDKVFNVNVKGIFLGTAAFMPRVIKQGEGGVMLNIASIGAVRPRPGLVWYNASKGAATKGLAAEYGAHQIRVNSVCPLLSGTGLFESFAGHADTPENRLKFIDNVPLKRLCEVSDVADTCLFLASDESKFITGINLEFGIPVPLGKVATTSAEAEAIIREFNKTCIIKPQILGRSGKAETIDGGFEDRFIQVNDAKAAGNVAKAMLSHNLEASSGGEVLANKLFITEMINYETAWFLAITFDRENSCPIIIASKRGGIDMETTVQQYPEQFHTFRLGYTRGITREVIERVSKFLDASTKERDSLQRILGRLYRIFTAKDATLLEIRSLARSHDGTLTCLDSSFAFDDAASKRQEDVFSLRDIMHEISEEVEAEKYGLVYVKMDGNIGNVVNGAGLAMATNDAIALYGGSSANFLDAGGQATKDTMIILRDERVKTILVNIYGGITRGDMIAESILGAAKELGPLKVPMVVRLQGTNSELGLKMLEEADLGLHTEADFGKAAEKAVELARGSAVISSA
ncbi:uncharacterized protein LY79DRAFT_592189 [Colletotrichum navitas]|uniref:Uncharacterized protein n=1 Tax=Colletotrichum navitas TaxID=681940 RepID=A0AAD8V234_9PEZI|nr:uncharacterized protein LY79DRAFT_592189 [Colletotrichum navitas]KAK1580372.1 hypothetical protein LY79DRAFT_592189 [Colletotrichum navitas]